MNNRAERDTEQGPHQPINNRGRVLPPSLGDQQVHRAMQNWPRWGGTLWKNHAPRSTGVDEAKENIHHHYDLGNEFYRLWLDQAEMQYTCAYYEKADVTLEQARLAKLEHVCRKLRLRPGLPALAAKRHTAG